MTGVHVDPAPTVADLRHSPVMTIGGGDTLWDAWQLMFVSGMRHLAVVDERGNTLGVLSDRAILTDLPLTEHHLVGRHVSDVMSSPGSITDETPTQEAASRMARYAVDALPIVTEAGRPIALLTAADLVDWVARD
ncbi:MAG: HPP family protein [Candidatus Nanopelagicales bacterium]|jgi:CBS domain-containing protein